MKTAVHELPSGVSPNIESDGVLILDFLRFQEIFTFWAFNFKLQNVFTPSSPTSCFSQTDPSYLQVSILLLAFNTVLGNGQPELGLLPSVPWVPLWTIITTFSGCVHVTPTFPKFSMLSLNLFLDFNLLNDSTIEIGLCSSQSPVIIHNLVKNSDCPWSSSTLFSHNLPKDIYQFDQHCLARTSYIPMGTLHKSIPSWSALSLWLTVAHTSSIPIQFIGSILPT